MLPIERIAAQLAGTKAGCGLTVYLRTDRFRGGRVDLRRELDLAVSALAHRLARRGADPGGLEAEAALVVSRLEEVRPGSRGLALFSCAAGGIFHALPLDAPVISAAYWGEGFDLGPLARALARTPRMVVALARPGRIRFFRVFGGEIEDAGEVCAAVGEDEPGPSLGRATAALRRLLQAESVERVLVGGDVRVLGAWREVLPDDLGQRVERCPRLRADAKPAEVLERALEERWRMKRAQDEQLVDDLLRAADAGLAAIGPDAVAEAVGVGEAGRLVVPEGFQLPGWECSACGLLAPAGAPEHCPVCGARLLTVPDLVARMEERVADAGGSIEEIGGQPAALLAEHEGIGAFLRGSLSVGAGA